MPYMLPGFFCDRVIRERDRRNGEGTITQPVKFEGQDFISLKEWCLAQKCLFEDRVFSAGVQALGSHVLSQKTKMKAITWKRPKVGMGGIELQVTTPGTGGQMVQSLRPWIPPLSKWLIKVLLPKCPQNTFLLPPQTTGVIFYA